MKIRALLSNRKGNYCFYAIETRRLFTFLNSLCALCDSGILLFSSVLISQNQQAVIFNLLSFQ